MGILQWGEIVSKNEYHIHEIFFEFQTVVLVSKICKNGNHFSPMCNTVQSVKIRFNLIMRLK